HLLRWPAGPDEPREEPAGHDRTLRVRRRHDKENPFRARLVAAAVSIGGIHGGEIVEPDHGGHVRCDDLSAHSPDGTRATTVTPATARVRSRRALCATGRGEGGLNGYSA